jgi:ribonuclease T2
MNLTPRLMSTALCACVVVAANASSRHHHHPADTSGKFDYYVMSLSWSPTFCETHQTNPQCAQHPGLVLHGLWPQYQSGGYPQHCATSERLTDEARALGVTVFPTEDLMVHEWQTHGTCNGTPALDYFKSAQSAHGSIAVPAALQPGGNARSMTGQQIVAALKDANPALTSKSLALTCSHQEFSEVRICLSKDDLKPISCGSQVSGSCGTAPVKVPGAQ